jgi:hypothetical protein
MGSIFQRSKQWPAEAHFTEVTEDEPGVNQGIGLPDGNLCVLCALRLGILHGHQKGILPDLAIPHLSPVTFNHTHALEALSSP